MPNLTGQPLALEGCLDGNHIALMDSVTTPPTDMLALSDIGNAAAAEKNEFPIAPALMNKYFAESVDDSNNRVHTLVHSIR